MKSKMKKLGREIAMNVADNSSKMLTKNDYLPRGVITIIRRKCVALIDDSKIMKDPLGSWLAIPFSMSGKCVFLINVHRIPVLSQQEPKYSLTQCNVIEGKAKGTTKHRKEIFKQIVAHINSN